MMRLLYRLASFALLAALLYFGATWGERAIVGGRRVVAIEKTIWEMDSLWSQIEFSVTHRPDDLQSLAILIERAYPNQRHIEEMSNDAWGTPYVLDIFEETSTYRLWSAGPDGEFGTEDDIVQTKTFTPET